MTESVDESYHEPDSCLLNEVEAYNSFLVVDNTLQLNFTCTLYLHTIYDGHLLLIRNKEMGQLELEGENYEILLTFSE